MCSAIEEEFQRMWKIASTAQFVKVFQEVFKLPEIEIETLEEGLLNKSMYGIYILKNLIVALLKGVNPNGGARLDNFDHILKRVVGKIWILEERHEENPLNENTNFENLLPLSKLDILYSLCLYLLDKASDPRSKWKDQVSKMSSDLLRVQPLGCDDEGNEYWYFYGTRLYKQEPSKDKKIKDWEEEWNTQKNTSLVKRGRGRPRKIKPRKSDGESDESEEALTNRSSYMNLGEKSRWSVVCNTLDDWVEFAEKFKDSKSKCERTLFRTLTGNFLPVMNEAYQAKEKKLQQKLRELIPKPTFTRMETRQKRIKSAPGTLGTDVGSRERRLEERNHRLNQSAENGPRRRSRSRISYDESFDFDDELSTRPRKRLSFVKNDDEDFIETTIKRSKIRESMEAQANEIVKEYASLVSNNNDNKSQVLRVFTQVKLDKNSYPFHYAIDKKEFPDYYDFISEPMDLSRIERKLRLNIYKTAAEIDDDFKLMVENCKLYFGVDSERSQMGKHTWRLFRRLMTELPSTAKQSETGSKEKPVNVVKKKTVEKSECFRKKQKLLRSEALDILSKEAELAVERSQSLDEEHFQNFTHSTKKCTQFSDLKVETIHSHPSDLIERFISESSNQGSEETSCDKFSTIDNQTSDISHGSSEDMGVDDHGSHEEDSNSSQLLDKNDPKNFNILSSDNEANLLSDNEMDPHSASNSLSVDFADNCFGDQKSKDDDLNNVSGALDNISTSPVNNSFESYHSPNSSTSDLSPKDNFNPQDIESNTTFIDGYEFDSFAPENESNGSSTVDASCLGLASASIYKKHQLEIEPKASIMENIAQVSGIYNGSQNLYNGFSKLNSRTQEFPRNQSRTKALSSCDQPMRDQFPHQEISRGEAGSRIQAFPCLQGPLVNQEQPKSPLAYSSYSSHQFFQGQIQNQESSTIQFRYSSEQEVHQKAQDLEHSQRQSRCSPPFLSNDKVQDRRNIESQPNCSPVLSTNQEVDSLGHSRNHVNNSPASSFQNTTFAKDSFTLNEEQRMQEQEVINSRIQNFSSQKEITSHDSAKNHQRYSLPIPFSPERQRQASGNDQSSSSIYSMHHEMQTPLSVIQEHIKSHPKHSALSPSQEMQGPEMVKSRCASIPPTTLKSAENQQRHEETQQQRPVRSQMKNSNKQEESGQMRVNSHQEVENDRSQPMTSSLTADQQLNKNQNSTKIHQLYWDQYLTGNQPAPSFSNQGITMQESTKSSPQHMHNISTGMQNQVPVEAPAFDCGNTFSNTLNSMNTSEVTESQFSANSVMQIASQVPVSHSNQNNMTRPNFPTMKVRLPPSTGELIVVPGDPSSMTFHLLAKPLSDPSQPIQSSVEIHANNQMRNRDILNNESARTRGKNSVKQDTVQAPHKQSSSILNMQHLASNPRKSSTYPSSVKNKNSDTSSHSSRSSEPPALANDSSMIKPNAMLVRPLEPIHSMQPHLYQQEPFVQSIEGPRTLPIIFPKGSRMTSVLGSSVNVNSQRPIMPNAMVQNGGGQYMFVPSKDILQSNGDQNLKMKNPERPPLFYPSNMMQSFPFQNGQMNPVQMLPQVHLPHVNPYYIVGNTSAFQNASRYPVMNMQPIPFQNR